MLYHSLKILHILSAAILLIGIVYSIRWWFRRQNQPVVAIQKIQKQTWLTILPFAFFQLITGFTMISLQKNDFSSHWIIGNIIGFILFISSWFAFIYFLPTKRLQWILLSVISCSFMILLFLMSNKIGA